MIDDARAGVKPAASRATPETQKSVGFARAAP
jgi:hypothetical protein